MQAAANNPTMLSPYAVICLTLVAFLASQGSFVSGFADTYSGLVAGGHVVPLNIKLSYLDDDHPNRAPYNRGMQCLVDDDRCQKPVFKKQNGAVLLVSLKMPAGNQTNVLKKYKDVELGEPTTLTLKLCYAKESTVDRKWRKPNDSISKDKRCSKSIAKDLDLASHSGHVNYTVPSDTPKAKFFLTAYLNCPIKGSTGKTQICGFDTTGGLDALVSREAVMAKLGIAGTTEEADERMDAETSTVVYFRTMSSHRFPKLLVGGVIAFSIFSVLLLVFFLVYEHVLRKKK